MKRWREWKPNWIEKMCHTSTERVCDKKSISSFWQTQWKRVSYSSPFFRIELCSKVLKRFSKLVVSTAKRISHTNSTSSHLFDPRLFGCQVKCNRIWEWEEPNSKKIVEKESQVVSFRHLEIIGFLLILISNEQNQIFAHENASRDLATQKHEWIFIDFEWNLILKLINRFCVFDE